MKPQQYKSILGQCLKAQRNIWAQKNLFTGTGDFIFIHNGAECHKGHEVRYFFSRIMALKFYPGTSPDMNPIKNLSAFKTRRWRKGP